MFFIKFISLCLTIISALSVIVSTGGAQPTEKSANHKTITLEINGSLRQVNDWRETENYFLSVVGKYGYDPAELLIVDSENLTDVILEHRAGAGFILVERMIGICVDRESGDGKILNCGSPIYNYTSYREFDQEYTDGTIILTYLIYDPTNNEVDDIKDRFDYVLDREYED